MISLLKLAPVGEVPTIPDTTVVQHIKDRATPQVVASFHKYGNISMLVIWMVPNNCCKEFLRKTANGISLWEVSHTEEVGWTKPAKIIRSPAAWSPEIWNIIRL